MVNFKAVPAAATVFNQQNMEQKLHGWKLVLWSLHLHGWFLMTQTP